MTGVAALRVQAGTPGSLLKTLPDEPCAGHELARAGGLCATASPGCGGNSDRAGRAPRRDRGRRARPRAPSRPPTRVGVSTGVADLLRSQQGAALDREKPPDAAEKGEHTWPAREQRHGLPRETMSLARLAVEDRRRRNRRRKDRHRAATAGTRACRAAACRRRQGPRRTSSSTWSSPRLRAAPTLRRRDARTTDDSRAAWSPVSPMRCPRRRSRHPASHVGTLSTASGR